MKTEVTSPTKGISHKSKQIRRKIKLNLVRSELRKKFKETKRLKTKVFRQKNKINSLESTLHKLAKDDVIPGEELVNLIGLSSP